MPNLRGTRVPVDRGMHLAVTPSEQVSFDALLKRYFPAVVLLLVAAIAYFQAAGLTQLLGAMITVEQAPPPPAKALSASGSAAGDRASKSAEPILARNVFDSVTGPIGQDDEPESPEKREPQTLDLSDPLGAPACSNVKVAIITESADPVWSIAALQGDGEDKPKIRRVGDSVGDKEVAYIGYNPRAGSPAVWLTSGSTLCQGLLFATQPEPAKAAPVAQEPDSSTRRPSRGAPKVPDDIASKIQKVSPNEFNIDRGVVDKILENQAELMKSARIVPEQKDGVTVGIRLFGIRPDTLLGTLGFQNGDRLETINGFNMASPEKALEAYARLRTADGLAVKINRRGKPQTIDFNIK